MNTDNGTVLHADSGTTPPRRPPLLLGSGSPRRRAILKELGIDFEVVVADVEEERFPDDAPRTAREAALAKHLWLRERHPGRELLTADTVVEFEGRCIVKPRDFDDAVATLVSYSGKPQNVYTGVVYSPPAAPGGPRPEPVARVVKSTVWFKEITPELAARYVSEARTLDRAGAYDINTLGDWIIASYEGSYTNIMGLPAELVRELVLS